MGSTSEVGNITIPTALKKLEAKRAERAEQETGSTRNEFLVVLWDDEGAPPNDAPERSYRSKTYPHIAFFRFHEAGDCSIGSSTMLGLAKIVVFVVPVEPNLTIKKQGRLFCKASCRFLTLSLRGNVPEPSAVPGQIIEGGFEGVVRMIEALFPNELKAVSTTREHAPSAWEFVPRKPSATASTNASEAASDSARSGTSSADASSTRSGAARPRKAGSGRAGKAMASQSKPKSPAGASAKQAPVTDTRRGDLRDRLKKVPVLSCELVPLSTSPELRIEATFARQDAIREVLTEFGVCPIARKRPRRGSRRPGRCNFQITVRLPEDWRVP